MPNAYFWPAGEDGRGVWSFRASGSELHYPDLTSCSASDDGLCREAAPVLLLGAEPIAFRDRAHFLAISAETMRRILIDHARARVANKRGGVQQRVSLSAVEAWSPVAHNEDVLVVDLMLTKLEAPDPRAAKVIELQFFGGLTEEEVADVLHVSVITVKRDWKVARAWLVNRLQANRPQGL